VHFYHVGSEICFQLAIWNTSVSWVVKIIVYEFGFYALFLELGNDKML
jgi:hypothetical protein